MRGVDGGERQQCLGDRRARAPFAGDDRITLMAGIIERSQVLLPPDDQRAQLARCRRLAARARRAGARLHRRGERRRRSAGAAGHRQRVEPGHVAEVALLAQEAIERANRFARQLRAVGAEAEVRRPQQRHDRIAREAGFHGVDDEIDRRGGRLGGERQRVDGAIRRPAAAEQLRGEVQLRQRLLEDDRRAIERHRITGAPIGLHAPCSVCRPGQTVPGSGHGCGRQRRPENALSADPDVSVETKAAGNFLQGAELLFIFLCFLVDLDQCGLDFHRAARGLGREALSLLG